MGIVHFLFYRLDNPTSEPQADPRDVSQNGSAVAKYGGSRDPCPLLSALCLFLLPTVHQADL